MQQQKITHRKQIITTNQEGSTENNTESTTTDKL